MEGSEKQEETVFEHLMAPLRKVLSEIENSRQKYHTETLSYEGFVSLLVYYFSSGTGSGRLLITALLSVSPSLKLPTIKKTAFFEGFTRFPISWYERLLTELLKQSSWLEIPELATLGKLYCVDGSLFPALAKMLWAEYKPGCNALKLHLVFELNRMIPVHFLVDSGNSNEKTALKQLLEKGVTYIADRGYVKFSLLADIVTAQAFFVFRMKDNLKFRVVETLPVGLPETVDHLFIHLYDQLVTLPNAAGKPTYRLVSFYIGETRFLILTNRLKLTTFQIILIYAYRWQVELMFRFLKRSLNGLHLLSQSPEGITVQFYLILITTLLQLQLKQSCVSATQTQTVPTQTNLDNDFEAETIAQTIALQKQPVFFFATVGDKLHRFWKIGIHWLHSLRYLIDKPFDPAAIHILGST